MYIYIYFYVYKYKNIFIRICVIILTYFCSRLHLIKICLCCFLVIHLYSNNLSNIATISSLIISELFPACVSCNNNFILLHNSLGSDDRNIVFEKPEAETTKPGELSNFISFLSRIDLLPTAFFIKMHFLCKIIH